VTKKYFKDLPHYIPLIGIFTSGVLAFLIFSYDKQFQIGVALSLAAGHFAWGIVHHMYHNDFSPEVVLEYFAISILGLVAVLSVILQF
jgi:hypothetical protein